MRASFFVAAVHQVIYHAARSAQGPARRPVGASLTVPQERGTVLHWYAPPAEPDGEPELVEPDGRPNVLGRTARPGIYRAVLAGDGRRDDHLFVVNVDTRESNPQRADAEPARQWLGPERTTLVRELNGLASLAERRRRGLPLWNYLLALALAVAVVETYLANVVLKR
jgi:hypothetical protein